MPAPMAGSLARWKSSSTRSSGPGRSARALTSAAMKLPSIGWPGGSSSGSTMSRPATAWRSASVTLRQKIAGSLSVASSDSKGDGPSGLGRFGQPDGDEGRLAEAGWRRDQRSAGSSRPAACARAGARARQGPVEAWGYAALSRPDEQSSCVRSRAGPGGGGERTDVMGRGAQPAMGGIRILTRMPDQGDRHLGHVKRHGKTPHPLAKSASLARRNGGDQVGFATKG